GLRRARGGRENAGGLRDDERDAVTRLEAAGAKRAAQGERRVPQRGKAHVALPSIRVHEDAGAGAGRGIVECLRNRPNHREPTLISASRCSRTCATVRIASMSFSGIETSKRSSSSAMSSYRSRESKPRSSSRSLAAVGSTGRRLTRFTIARISASSERPRVVIGPRGYSIDAASGFWILGQGHGVSGRGQGSDPAGQRRKVGTKAVS